MSDPTLESLFWDEVDESGSAERQRQIGALVEKRPELRRELDELRSLAARLEEVAEEPPPPELWAGVRRAIAARTAYRKSRGIGDWLRALAGRGWRPRLVYATIAVVVGVVTLHLVTGWPPAITGGDGARFSGALNVGDHGEAEPLEMELADSMGTVSLSREGTLLTARVSAVDGTPLRVTLDADSGLELVRAAGTEPSRYEVVSRSGPVEVIVEGPLVLEVELGEESAALQVRIATLVGDSLLARRVDLDGASDR